MDTHAITQKKILPHAALAAAIALLPLAAFADKVVNANLTHLARVAFSDSDSRVLDSDLAKAIQWLSE